MSAAALLGVFVCGATDTVICADNRGVMKVLRWLTFVLLAHTPVSAQKLTVALDHMRTLPSQGWSFGEAAHLTTASAELRLSRHATFWLSVGTGDIKNSICPLSTSTCRSSGTPWPFVAGLQLNLLPSQRNYPYLGLGGGTVYWAPYGTEEDLVLYAGFNKALFPRWCVRAEVIAHSVIFETGISLGLARLVW